MLRVLVVVLWLVVLGGCAFALRLPRALDLYIKDRYVVIPTRRLASMILLAFALPLLLFTIWSRHSAKW